MSSVVTVASSRLANGNQAQLSFRPDDDQSLTGELVLTLTNSSKPGFSRTVDLGHTQYESTDGIVTAPKGASILTWTGDNQTHAVLFNQDGVILNTVDRSGDGFVTGNSLINPDGSLGFSTYSFGASQAVDTINFRANGVIMSENLTSIVLSDYVSHTNFYDRSGALIGSRPGTDAIREEVSTDAATGVRTDTYYDLAGHYAGSERIAANGSLIYYDGLQLNAAGDAYEHVITTYNADGSYHVRHLDDPQPNVQAFNAAGTLIGSDVRQDNGDRLVVDYDPAHPGAMLRSTVLHQDGSKAVETFVTGQTYATQTLSYDDQGKLTQLERDYADGSVQMRQSFGADGSSAVTSFDTHGRTVSSVLTAAGGAKDVVSFSYADDSAAKPSSAVATHYAASGTKILTDTSNADGSHRIQALVSGVTLAGHAGSDDLLVGAPLGSTTLAFGESIGHDTVWNFKPGTAAHHDVIQLSASLASDFQHLQSHLSTVGGDTLISFDSHNSILLHGVTASSLVASDFAFV
ncbi:hypothetical protein [Sphingomonas morindae]|uniref:YD repeat-containing protein n=1 Tax=Sphingomonas morindae TaxID=1541170 RepID=A0ABY4XA15_9SPHN|nr:hypothetical protein [Sphingomonas morindae]USI73763.1 hypothetical protein LHA26_04650 [Sphingomonas morindae]